MRTAEKKLLSKPSLPVVVGQLEDPLRIATSADVVDEHVDPIELGQCGLRHQCGPSVVGEVRDHGDDPPAETSRFGRRPLESLGAAGVEHEVGALRRELHGRRPPDALAGAGHDDDTVPHP